MCRGVRTHRQARRGLPDRGHAIAAIARARGRMLFQSQGYVLAFLPLAAAAYYLSARSLALRQYVLIVASLVFYAWWDWRFLVLPVAQIAVTWVLSRAHGRTGRAGFLHAGIALNLASLGTFKYLNFVLASLGAAAGGSVPPVSIVLPIG